jgi:hypothetical protein
MYDRNKSNDTTYYHKGGVADAVMNKEFYTSAAGIMMSNYGDNIMANDPEGKRTIAISQQINKNIKEGNNMNKKIDSIMKT